MIKELKRSFNNQQIGKSQNHRMMLEVIEPGLLTTVQDGGRWGWARYGIPPSGPLDAPALQIANQLVGNAPTAAGLEITLTGLILRAAQACLIAVCGAEFALWIDNLPIPTWHACLLRAGQHLYFGERRSGARAYLAVSGGLALPEFLGSQATYLPGRFGGLAGRALRPGDQLPHYAATLSWLDRAGAAWPRELRPSYAPTPTLRVVLGPQADAFTPAGLETFLTCAYTLTPACDRMGARCSGPTIAHRAAPEIISDGVVNGSVQIPPDGQPIIMLADHQTTGGYPKIGVVIQRDLPQLAQCLPGDTIRFATIEVAAAQQLYVSTPLSLP